MSNLENDINCLVDFLERRDLSRLNQKELKKNYGIDKADLFVLFGGSILCGGDVLAEAIQNNIARKYIIVGGQGHTTDTLRKVVKTKYPQIDADHLSEAQIFQEYIKQKYHVQSDYLECESTHCGNNITNLLQLIKKNQLCYENVIICQDATMQLRMEKTLKKYEPHINIINYASYVGHVIHDQYGLHYREKLENMWSFPRYISLLLGEISRLNDDQNGYGPCGKNYLVHVDIPENVLNAFYRLQKHYHIRKQIQ